MPVNVEVAEIWFQRDICLQQSSLQGNDLVILSVSINDFSWSSFQSNACVEIRLCVWNATLD